MNIRTFLLCASLTTCALHGADDELAARLAGLHIDARAPASMIVKTIAGPPSIELERATAKEIRSSYQAALDGAINAAHNLFTTAFTGPLPDFSKIDPRLSHELLMAIKRFETELTRATTSGITFERNIGREALASAYVEVINYAHTVDSEAKLTALHSNPNWHTVQRAIERRSKVTEILVF